ncbi:LacI family DNA-binding transcriptional regulator [Reinekea marinisedimentorum]|uniref:LacI family sucrose operon transcriptional repressor n=1 Tax=Reinekea marinisedimentorum TaxID=230495 RepID=A0A4R3I8A8_9GAMM|nr:LacI family DNA-binding transcriptional regulator [Reinekea marinisedimentorum]TCS42354.1 LacI family sucrose operon transcriptional repressor [Reinekea marinisedimentorum]
MPSLYDVARIAGVSKSTVSRVINNEAGVKQNTRDKVFSAIEESGYVVNQVAKDLKSQTTNLVGVIVPRISSHAISAGVEEISKIAEADGKQVLLANSRQEHGKELEFIGLFNQKRVAGIIIFATHVDEKLILAIHTSKVPVVVVGQDTSSYGIPCVLHDDLGVGEAAARLLNKAGCSQVGFIGARADDIAVDTLRYQGFATETLNLTGKEPQFRSNGDFSVLSGNQQVQALLDRGVTPDGIFCATDDLAIGAIQALVAAGLTPGKDVQLVSVGNDEKAEIITPSLTAFSYAFDSAGHEAAELLMGLCNNKTKAVTKLVLGFSLVERDSCRC